MSVCRWCTPAGDSTAELLQKYCDGSLSNDEEQAVEEDLIMCMECLVEYHRVRKDSPQLHKGLWKLETLRLLNLFSSVSKEGLENDDEQYDGDDDLYLIENGQEHKVPEQTHAEYAHRVRLPLTEILMYPYLLGHPKLSEMCVDALRIMERHDSFQIFEKYPGTYLLLVHPNETVRRWAIGAAKSLGTVDRDDFYDLQDIFSCMFLVIELGISEIIWDCDNPTATWCGLPTHLYDPNNPKDYWLGICMLLTQLDAQAMDSLFHGPDKKANILQCIINTLKESAEDEVTDRNQDSFWPALQCFMVILDCMGSRIWGQIEPDTAFHAVTESPCYIAEIQNIKRESNISVKSEPADDHHDDDDDNDMVTCSQMVYDCKKVNEEILSNSLSGEQTGGKAVGAVGSQEVDSECEIDQEEKNTRRSHGTDDIVNYGEMMSLMELLKLDLGQAMRMHNSTFLWFIPFVKSIMELDNLIYIDDVINYICREINGDLRYRHSRACDKITEFFALILVHIIDLHLINGRMNLLYFCSGNWLEVVVKSASFPGQTFQGIDRQASGLVSSTSSSRFTSSRDVPQACMQLIRKLLKAGSRLSSDTVCSRFLNLINKQLREGTQKEWSVTESERAALQACLKQLVRQMMDRPKTNVTPPLEPSNTHPMFPPQSTSNTPGPKASTVNQPEAQCSVKQELLSHGELSSFAQTDQPMQKKAHVTPEDDTDTTDDSRVNVELASCISNPGNMTGFKSRLAQLIAQNKPDKKSLKQFLGKVESENSRPSTSISDKIKRDTSSPGTQSDSADEDDMPLVFKTRLKGPELKSPVPGCEEGASADIILISDTDDEDEETNEENGLEMEEKHLERVKTKSEPCDVDIDGDADLYRDYDGNISESQVFEFETQEYVVSAWDDSLLENEEPSATSRKESPVNQAFNEPSSSYCSETKPISDDDIERDFEVETQEDASARDDSHLENEEPSATTRKESPVCQAFNEPSSSYCSETQPISNDDIERAVQQVEKLGMQKMYPEGLKLAAIVKKRDLFVEPKPLPTKHRSKKAHSKERKMKKVPVQTPEFTREFPPLTKLDSKRQSNKSEDDAKPSTSTSSLFSPATPAIVPPKKVRKAAEPLSTAEKLGLKKKKRKVDLSQRSLDFVDQQRRYGQGVHVEQNKTKSRKSKKQKSTPQKCFPKGSKSKLSSQQLQFLMQSKAKHTASGAGTSVHATENKDMGPNKLTAKRKASDANRKPKGDEKEQKNEEEEEDDPLPCSQPDPIQRGCQASLDGSNGNNAVASDTQRMTSSDFKKSGDDVVPSTSGQADGEIEEEYDEPTDMEFCSQMEEMGEEFQHTQHDPVDMDISNSQMPLVGEDEPSDWTSPMEANEEQGFKKIEPLACSTSAQGNNDDHLFLKPGMSPMTRKKAKPSTTKIYATSSSRSDSLVEEMAKTADSVGRPRPTRPNLPVRRSGTPQPSTRVTQAQPPQMQSALMPPPKPPQPKLPPATAVEVPHTLPSPVAKSYRPLQPSTSGSVIQPPTYKIYARPEAPLVKQMPVKDMFRGDLPPMGAIIQRDPYTPVQQILKWSYERFQKYRNEEICTFSLAKVGIDFRSFNEYYNTFYPLLLLNTFEELAEEWHKNIAAKRVITQQLTIVHHPNSNGVWTFKTIISAHEESRQLHPREEDLVILWLTQNTGGYSRNEPEFSEPTPHLGCVQKSSVISGDHLNLVIKTHGSVTSVKDQPVRCEVVGSLVTTLREYKGLCALKNSTMKVPLLAPREAFFQSCQEQPSSSNFPGYNSAQSRAIRSGVAVVRNPKGTPKICVIHGPPGTGKSKTIVGLLDQLFSEGHITMAPATPNRPAGRRRMRVLLCAPSNAAIDNLMKKVILDLKERWQRKNMDATPGNCGELNLVRLGNEKTMEEKIRAYSLDNQTMKKTQKAKSHEPELHRRKMELDEKIEMVSMKCIMQRKETLKYQDLAQEKAKLLTEREKLSNELKQCCSKRKEIQARVLQEAHIIFCTLSTSGSSVLESAFRHLGHEPFSCVIVDEAGQAKETETLIPMLYDCKALVLVGDPEQLPPTVISQRAKDLNYGQSLMDRLCRCMNHSYKYADHSPVILLRQQYRMHPDICNFPSKYIYYNALETDPDTAVKRCAVSWPFQSYRLFDVIDGREIKEGDSYSNEQEVKLLMVLLKLITDKQVKVGVITPYNAQKERIKREMSKIRHASVAVDTVDGFQGREMDCIIVSCVRASHEGGIGFLKNRQRLNVTITRAKNSLFILGHLRTLKTDRDWGALIDDAGRRGTVIRTDESVFKREALKIFKPDPGFSRSLSYPSRDAEASFRQSTGAPAPVQYRTAHITQRRTSDPAQSSVQSRSSSVYYQPSPTSPPQAVDRPTDPRLAARAVQAPPPPPQHRVDTRTQTRQDPRGQPATHPQAENARDVWMDRVRDSYGEGSRDGRAESRGNPQRESVRDPRIEHLRDSDSSHGQRMDRDRDYSRDRVRRSSPDSVSHTGDREPRDPRQPRYPSPSDTRTQDSYSYLQQKRASNPHWIPPTQSKRGKK